VIFAEVFHFSSLIMYFSSSLLLSDILFCLNLFKLKVITFDLVNYIKNELLSIFISHNSLNLYNYNSLKKQSLTSFEWE